ncbi:MFS transporter [Allostreptomyces psammosilenae]|uniref:MFS family permease n=1 Tax=Allostreptomyces psammosilenae TaxID=1892865 RepID=A0A852ZQJ2_9ACTN|nr:MFS transporter [Allostreptomyces psammosilenae]NYI03134.1 MFS family permease [Allostreptomyces psammosilenae]
MPSPYREIFRAPGTLGFSSAGFVARMPVSMLGIGVVTMLSAREGAYGLAGAVSATLALAAAVIAPQISRLVDRHGQRRVLLPSSALALAGVVGLLLCARLDAPSWTLFPFAVLAGSAPNMGAMVRARWVEVHRGTPRLHTAYSFEAVLDELTFILGPIVSVWLCTQVFPEAGPAAAGVLLAVGVTLFVAQRRTEPPVRARLRDAAGAADGDGDGGSAIRSAGLRLLVVTFLATGAIFGAVDVTVVAFADELGQTEWASVALACFAGGSCLAALLFGLLKPSGPPARRFQLGVLAMALGTVPLLFVTNLPLLSAAGFLMGLCISPTMITVTALTERLVPPSKLTEGMTWTTTGLAAGVAAGSSVSGWVIDGYGARTAFWVPVAAAAIAAVLALLGGRLLTPPKREPSVPVASGGPSGSDGEVRDELPAGSGAGAAAAPAGHAVDDGGR